ncbi:hypothetical protein NADFUDRAFT_63587 [Nadsonia fulvescens var. elongata DSM 6958]|uniref:Uncharacterized protein n=1 Tax=Nadsonia fulvescens var. elongata DSM 6958 TaxID=857566 RepID=A0A1E3PRR8_9ASCO|nr:hypothetical protein NADFUDRAFT_63587 [Nadsonia fulvescens var. elongata DSM 6958]
MFYENISELTLHLSDRPDKLSKPIYVPRKPVAKDKDKMAASSLVTIQPISQPTPINTVLQSLTSPGLPSGSPNKVKRKPVGISNSTSVEQTESRERSKTETATTEAVKTEAEKNDWSSKSYNDESGDDSDCYMENLASTLKYSNSTSISPVSPLATSPTTTAPWLYHVLKNLKDFYLTTNPTEFHLNCRVGPSYYVTTSVTSSSVPLQNPSEAGAPTRINSRHSGRFRSLSMLRQEDMPTSPTKSHTKGLSSTTTAEGLVFNFQANEACMVITRWKSFSGGNTWLDIKITITHKNTNNKDIDGNDDDEYDNMTKEWFTNAIPIPQATASLGPSYALVYKNQQYVVGPKLNHYSNGKPKHSTKIWFSSLENTESRNDDMTLSETNYAVFRRRKNALQLVLHPDQISSQSDVNNIGCTPAGTEADVDVGNGHDVDKIGWLTIAPLETVTQDPIFWNLIFGVTTIVAYAARIDDKDKRLSSWFKKVRGQTRD